MKCPTINIGDKVILIKSGEYTTGLKIGAIYTVIDTETSIGGYCWVKVNKGIGLWIQDMLFKKMPNEPSFFD